MAQLLAYLGYVAYINETGAYILIAIGAALSGDLAALLGSILAYRGYLAWTGVIFASVAGIIVSNNVIYQLGLSAGDTKIGLWIKSRLPYQDYIKNRLGKNFKEVMIFSKFVVGFHFAILFMSGYLGIRRSVFILSDLLALAIWTAVIFPVGYGIATALYGFEQLGLRRIELLIALAIGIILVLHWAIAKLIRKFKLSNSKDNPGNGLGNNL